MKLGRIARLMLATVICVATVLTAGLLFSSDARKPKIAITLFSGDDDSFGAELSDALAILLEKAGAVETLQRRQVEEYLKKSNTSKDDLNDAAVAARVGNALGASGLILGTCNKKEGMGYTVDLRFLSLNGGGVVEEVKQHFEGGQGRIFILLRGWADVVHEKTAGSRIPESCGKKSGKQACAPEFLKKADPVYRFVSGNRDFGLRAWLDHTGENHEPPSFRDGGKIKIHLQANRNCFVYLMGVDAAGDLKPLYVDAKSWPVKVIGGKVYVIPGEQFPFEFVAHGSYGLERVAFLATDFPATFDKKLNPVDSRGAAVKKDAADFLNQLSFIVNQPGLKGVSAAAAVVEYYIESGK
jgi:hypothetical protein